MISWTYLDKRDATIKALKDYDSMKFIIENTSDEIKRTTDKMTSIGVPKYEDRVRSGNVHAGEDNIVGMIEEIDTLKERYRQAVEYMAWFEPAWSKLSEEEQFLLESFYLDDSPIDYLMEHFGLEKTATYNKKNRALNHLVKMLYGVA